MDINDLTYEIRGAIYTVHNELGPGLLESVYEAALLQEFKINGIQVLNQLPVGINYKRVELDIGFRIDILVENLVIIEIKSVKKSRTFIKNRC